MGKISLIKLKVNVLTTEQGKGQWIREAFGWNSLQLCKMWKIKVRHLCPP